MTFPWAGRFAGATRAGAVPERVSRAIRDQQDASERLIGWFQLAVVTLFGSLYAVSPKTFSADAEFAPVPWVLSVYVLFTVFRLWLSYRGRMHAAMLYASIVIDLGLLLGLIWSFHLQYMQPPSFYLKSPTLLYVFIFIALRALRFEARFVVVTGLVAALGWLVLASYAIYASGGSEMVTRDYVYYMTSNAVLIGAEFDKVVSILTVTAIIAVAIARARGLLTRAVTEGAAARDLSRFFAPEIAREITASEEIATAGHGRARDAAILICDIRGFTQLATTKDPDQLMGDLTDYQQLIVPIIQDHGGVVDKFMGDGILASFGAATPSDSYAADALRAAEGIRDAADRWNRGRAAAGKEVLEVGLAVATGRVVFGAVGDETRLEFTVIGEAVNLCAKLEKHNKVERVRGLATVETFEIALAQSYLETAPHERRAGRMVEGLDAPVDVVVLAP